MRKLSVSEVTTRNWTFAEDVKNYAVLDIDGIGVWRDKIDMYEVDDAVKMLGNSGLQVANLVDAGYFLAKTRSQTRRAIEDVCEAIQLASKLNTDCLLIVTGDLGSFFRDEDQARNIVIDSLKEIAPVASEAKVRLAIEPIATRYPGYTFLHDIPSTLKIIEAISSPMVGVLFDTDHLYQSPNLFQEIERAGDRIFCVHINDMPQEPGPGIDRKIPGDGVIPLKDILGAIDATGYKGFYDVEIMSNEVWQMDYTKLLKEIRKRFDLLWS